MQEIKFSDAHLSNLLLWQTKGDISGRKRQDVFWIKPLESGSRVYCYEGINNVNAKRFECFS
jgi:hypothetical protein